MLTFIKSLFQSEEKFIQNELVNLAMSFEEAKQAIKDAEEEFRLVKEMAIDDFTSLKQRTLDKTMYRVYRMSNKAHEEEARVNEKHQQALAKITGKKEAASRIQKAVQSLDFGFDGEQKTR